MKKKTKGSDLLGDVRTRVQKAGQAPGSPIYTGKSSEESSVVTIITYDSNTSHEIIGHSLPENFKFDKTKGVTWINVEGLHNVEIIKEIATKFELHPLTIEDILNITQRPKVEEFDNYIFITLKALFWDEKASTFIIKQSSLVVGQNFVLSFQELDTTLFDSIRLRLMKTAHQCLRQQGSDFLAYRLIDDIVDQYFIVLEAIGDQIEETEEYIISSPSPQIARIIYRLKRKMLMLRKAIWPIRETIGHLLHLDNNIFNEFTRIYLRDVYDHSIQAIDTLETFRDILSSMLDMYLSSLTNRMNEIMKTLTIITTIFIPITSIASIYGMNFSYIPGLHWPYGFPAVIFIMLFIIIGMMFYFRHKKWI